MNKKDSNSVHRTLAQPSRSPSKSGSNPERARRARRLPGSITGRGIAHALPKEAMRLLASLGQPEARAVMDPTDEGSVILHRKHAGVSIGAGRYALAAAETLTRHDLACWQRSDSGRRSLCLTEAGRAHLRRAAAPDPEAAFFHQHRETVIATAKTPQAMYPAGAPIM